MPPWSPNRSFSAVFVACAQVSFALVAVAGLSASSLAVAQLTKLSSRLAGNVIPPNGMVGFLKPACSICYLSSEAGFLRGKPAHAGLSARSR